MNLDIDITLENEKVRIEPLFLSHLNALIPIAEQFPDLLRYSPSQFGSEEHLTNYIKGALRERWNGKRYPFAIYSKVHEKFVGSTSYGNISEVNKRTEIGWTWLDPIVQGTGLNKQCKYLLLEHAFTTLRCFRVEFKCDAKNIQSRKALENIGAKYEGLLRSHTVLVDGTRRDTVYYSILKEEWEELKATVFKKL